MKPCAEKVKAEIQMMETGKEEEKGKAAEKLGTWASVSDENRVAISREGGAEALVALVVTGSEDAKWHAARALRNLANNLEAKEAILKADGMETLRLLVKHGKGKVKEAGDEAMKLLSHDKASAEARLDPEGLAAIPSGEGTRVAMFSARFDGGAMEKRLGQDICVPLCCFIGVILKHCF